MFALADALEVVVKEVNVQASLKDAREDLSPAVEVVEVVSVDPVENVEESVEAKCRHIMRGYVLNQSNLVQHHDLRDEGDGLEPKTVAPHELPSRPA